MEFKEITIRQLSLKDSRPLSDLMLSEDAGYSRYFIPFSFDYESIRSVLSNAKSDLYYGIFLANQLVGFFMLRGFDKGYEIPSYGVWITSRHSSKGLSKLSLQYTIAICKLNNIKKMMLKVHPDNLIAKDIYESFGFVYQGVDPKNKHLIYNIEL